MADRGKFIVIVFVLLLITGCEKQAPEDLPPPPPGISGMAVAAGEGCCVTDFSCMNTDAGKCAANSGTWQENVDCLDIDCPLMPDWATLKGPGFVFDLTVINSDLTIETDADVIWKNFYIFNATGDKQVYEFDQTPIAGSSYIADSASKTVADLEPGRYFVVAYACNRLNGEYNCNDEKWMIKKIEVFAKGDCYLQLPDEEIVIAGTKGDCQSYALAFQYANINDTLRLVIKENPEYKDRLMKELKGPAQYAVKYVEQKASGPETTYFDEEINNQECRWTNFFDVPLFCFNVNEGLGEGEKNYFKRVISPLTFIKMAGYSANYNSAQAYFKDRGFLNYEPYIEPFELLKKEEIIYVNGYALKAIGRALDVQAGEKINIDCGEELEEKTNSCFRFLDSSLKHRMYPYTQEQGSSGQPYPAQVMGPEVRFVGVMYLVPPKGRLQEYGIVLFHEAHHKLIGGHVTALDAKNCPTVQQLGYQIDWGSVFQLDFGNALQQAYDGRTGDRDWASPNGAEAELAFQLSANPLLDCNDRQALYQYAKNKLQNELCTSVICPQYPKEPWKCVDNLHIYPEPVCEAAVCGNQICEEGEIETCPEDCAPKAYDGYIVQFKEASVLETKYALESAIKQREAQLKSASPLYKSTFGLVESALISYSESQIDSQIEAQRVKIAQEHRNALSDIQSKITGSAVAEYEKLPGEYTDVFNGIFLQITDEQAEEISKLPSVKAVYPNNLVNITLPESVPLINAPQVWELDEDGNNCSVTGKECLTGKNVTIAIIDTGVDYTHPDLGATVVSERAYEKVTAEPVRLYIDESLTQAWILDQEFRIDNNKLAYISHNDSALTNRKNATFYIYSFDTKQTQQFDAYSNNLTVLRLAFRDNKLAYFAINPDNNDELEVYLYDLTTGEHKKISADIGSKHYTAGLIDISQGKIIYDFQYLIEALDFESVICIYDIASRNTEIVSVAENYQFMPMTKVSGNLVAFPVAAHYCYEKIVLYNMDTKSRQEITPPDLGPLLDFEGDSLAYVDCNATNFDPLWRHYHLYNITSGESVPFGYSYYEGAESGDLHAQAESYGLISWVNKASIAEDAVFFSKGWSVSPVMIYDKNLHQYGQLNTYLVSGIIDSKENRVCFLGRDMNIYCHDYDPANDYTIPEPGFNDKVIGGYDFVNNDEDPMDDHGHGTHCAGIAAGKGNQSISYNKSVYWIFETIGQGGGGAYITDDKIYLIELVAVSDNKAQFKVNDEITSFLGENEIYTLSDGAFVKAAQIVTEEKISVKCYLYVPSSTILRGVAPDAQIYAYKVLNAWGSGNWDDIISAIERSVDPNQDRNFSDHVDIISMSLGGPGNPDDAVSQAVDNAVRSGVVAVIAAGNSGPNYKTTGSPGTARKAITVGASAKDEYVIWFSSRGPVVWENKAIVKPDIVAPGVDICSSQWDDAWPDNQCLDSEHTSISGTSMATPHVAGAAALLLQKNPGWSPEQVKMALRSSAVDLNENIMVQGYGRIDVLEAANISSPCIAEINAGAEPDFTIIKGTAYCDNLKNYTISYAVLDDNYNPSDFTQMHYSAEPVTDNILYSGFSTAGLADGLYQLKLEVFDINGNRYEDNVLLTVKNFDFKVGNTLNYIKGKEAVRGTIMIAGYDAYKVEYKQEGAETWNQVCYKEQAPLGDMLCSVDVSSFENGVYYFRVSARKDGNWISSNPLKTAVLKEMADNWPVEINGFPAGIVNMDKINSKLIVPHYNYCIQSSSAKSGSYQGNSILMNSAGIVSKTTEYNISNIYVDKMQGLSSAQTDAGIFADCYGSSLYFFNPNSSFEKFVYSLSDYAPVVFYDTEQNENYIALHNDYWPGGALVDAEGNYIYNWSNEVNYGNGPLVVCNVNETEEDKFFSLSFEPGFRINGFDKHGVYLDNFPINVQPEQGKDWVVRPFPQLFDYNGSKQIAFLVGNFNNVNGKWQDLVVYMDIYSLNGSRIKRNILFNGAAHELHTAFLAAGDINNDNNSEIAVGFFVVDQTLYFENQLNPEAYTTYFYIFDGNGTLVSQVPPIKGYSVRKMIIADLGNGPEIIAALSDTFPTTANGNRIISFDKECRKIIDTHLADYLDLIEGLVAADIDSDRETEIVINYRPRWYGKASGIQIFDNNGVLERDIEIPTMGKADDYWGNDPLIGDFDNDSKIDIVLQSLYIDNEENMNTRIYFINLEGNYSPGRLEWPVALHDAQHTGVYVPLIEKDCSLTYAVGWHKDACSASRCGSYAYLGCQERWLKSVGYREYSEECKIIIKSGQCYDNSYCYDGNLVECAVNECCVDGKCLESGQELCEQTGGAWRDCTLLKCPYSYFSEGNCICPPQSEWKALETQIKEKIRQGCSCQPGYSYDSQQGCILQ